MKKTFLKFNPAQKKFAPRMTGHRFRGMNLGGGIAYRQDGEEAEKGEAGEDPEITAIKKIGEQVEGFKKTLGEKADMEAFKKLETELSALKEGIKTLTAKQVTDALLSINKKNEDIHKQLVELQEAAAQDKEGDAGKAPLKGKLFTTKQVEDFVKTIFTEDGTKQNGNGRIEIKAAETFGYPTFFQGGSGTVIDAFTGRYVDPELNQRRRKKNFILDNLQIRTINVPKLVYLIKVEDGDDVGSASGDSGGADWILSGEIKPKRSFRVTTGEVLAKKVAIFGTVEDKLLKDVPSLENWIREDFMDEMYEKINDGLLNNNPAVDPDAPLGLKTNATAFAATPAFIDKYVANSSNYIDQIFALLAQMAYNREEAGMVVVSSDVYYRILSLKDNDGRYQNSNLVYVNALGELYIGGAKIVWADRLDVPSTNVLVIAKDLGFKIYAYGPMVFERGLNGEDFRYDRTSFRGYQEFLSYIASSRYNSVIYDTWANVKAGIEA